MSYIDDEQERRRSKLATHEAVGVDLAESVHLVYRPSRQAAFLGALSLPASARLAKTDFLASCIVKLATVFGAFADEIPC